MSEAPTFGSLLRQYRLAASLSQEALSERTSVSATAIAALERGRRNAPRPSTVLLLAEGLQLAPAEWAALIAAAGATRAAPAEDVVQLRLHVPAPLSSFVGRNQERAEVQRLLQETRLLTLIGPAGVGKTRLALEVARDTDEATFVELAAVSDGALIPQAIASALAIQEQPQQPLLQTLVAALQARHLLLVLDNCEHLLPECTEIVDTLMRACPRLSVLATSRVGLGVAGEKMWPVPVLSLPDLQRQLPAESSASSAAVRLFVERARSADPSFALTEQNLRSVAQLCIQLDGLPLAIELAAARVRALAPAQIVSRLDDRFRVLAVRNSSAPRRHQSLQAALDWSYDLLDTKERELFDRLAIFAGGWSLQAAEAVCAEGGIDHGEVPIMLSRLVDQSLVMVQSGPDGEPRYFLLETMREYAAERLERFGTLDALSERHRSWYLALGEQALQDYWLRRDLPGWWERLAAEQANVRAAHRFSLEGGEAEAGLRLVVGMWVLWSFRGPWTEGTDWIARLIALPGAAEHRAAYANALTVGGQMAFEQGDIPVARAWLREAVDLQRRTGSARGLAMALDHAGLAASAGGDFAASYAFHAEAVAVDRAAGNRGYEAISLEAWSTAAYFKGDYERARALAEASLAIVDSLNDGDGNFKVDANITLFILGRIELYDGDPSTARRHFEENISHLRHVGDARSRPAVGALVGLACVAVLEGDLDGARECLEEALALSERLGSRAALAYVLEGIAILAAAASQPEQALRLASAADALRASLQYPISPAELAVLERWLAPARALLGEQNATIAWETGQSLSARRAAVNARALLVTG